MMKAWNKRGENRHDKFCNDNMRSLDDEIEWIDIKAKVILEELEKGR
jgi:hypothetical protein